MEVSWHFVASLEGSIVAGRVVAASSGGGAHEVGGCC